MGSEIQALDKTNKLLSVMTVCRNAFHNGTMAHICHKFGYLQSVNAGKGRGSSKQNHTSIALVTSFFC